MMEDTTTTADPAAERQSLLADPDWRALAMNPSGRQWAELQRLDGLIAGQMEAQAAADDALATQDDPPVGPAVDDDEAFEGADFNPPGNAHDYALPVQMLRDAGLPTDPMADRELKHSLHGAGVDQHLAMVGYATAINAMRPADPVRDAADALKCEQTLRDTWGASYDDNVKAANAEAHRIFAALPASMTGGDFDTFVEISGIGRSAAVIRHLAARGRKNAA